MTYSRQKRSYKTRQNAKKLTEDDILNICKLAKSGRHKCIEIAALYGVSPSFITQILRGKAHTHIEREIINFTKSNRKISEDIAKKIISLKKEHLTNKQIADRLDISAGSVAKVLVGDLFPELDRTNVQTRLYPQPTTRLTKEQCIEICKKIDEGTTQYSLAKEYGVSRGHICRISKGKIHEDVRASYVSINSNSGRKVRHESIKKQDHWKAKKNNMVYNEYGMLVPIN